MSVERLRGRGYEARFVAVRLPYGKQRDEEDAQLALQFVRPDEVLSVNVKRASDEMLAALKQGARSMSTSSRKISSSATSRRASG